MTRRKMWSELKLGGTGTTDLDPQSEGTVHFQLHLMDTLDLVHYLDRGQEAGGGPMAEVGRGLMTEVGMELMVGVGKGSMAGAGREQEAGKKREDKKERDMELPVLDTAPLLSTRTGADMRVVGTQ